jgi:CspA family cold shock protein
MSSTKDSVTPSAAASSSDRLTGRVKWFNNKAGYGFITVTDGSNSGSDIFVHHSVIGVASQQYKYLVQGEYVDFEMSATQGGAHAFQAINVAGIKGGKLMCETRHEFKMARSAYKSTDEPTTVQTETKTKANVQTEYKPRVPRQKNVPTTEGDKKDWTFVGSKKPSRS